MGAPRLEIARTIGRSPTNSNHQLRPMHAANHLEEYCINPNYRCAKLIVRILRLVISAVGDELI